ncbi:MAG: hypothetical protein ABR505_08980 [Actinomycetota bacterium]
MPRAYSQNLRARVLAAAREELARLFDHLETEVTAMRDAGAPSGIETERDQLSCVVRVARVSLALGWHYSYANTLRYSGLRVREFDRPLYLRGSARRRREPTEEAEFAFTRTLEGRLGWAGESDGGRVWSSPQLADHYLKRLLDRMKAQRNDVDRSDDDDDDW